MALHVQDAIKPKHLLISTLETFPVWHADALEVSHPRSRFTRLNAKSKNTAIKALSCWNGVTQLATFFKHKRVWRNGKENSPMTTSSATPCHTTPRHQNQHTNNTSHTPTTASNDNIINNTTNRDRTKAAAQQERRHAIYCIQHANTRKTNF